MFNNKKSSFDKINDYLVKKGHELVFSIYLADYNGNNIYIRFDYVPKIAVYKIVWVDLNFLNIKHLESYINVQMLTKFISTKIIEKLAEIDYESGFYLNDDIIGDRVELLTYLKENKEYVFDRFLPLEWEKFIDPLALIFSYLPRGMEIFLNEIFAKFDGTEEGYNCLKPIKFNILKGDSTKIFRSLSISKGTELFEQNRVLFLEKVDNKYLAIVEDRIPYLVMIEEVDKEHALLWCNCKARYYCKHIYAVLLAIRENRFNNFYKVKFLGKEESLLDKVTLRNFYYSFGIRNGKLYIVTPDGMILPLNPVENGKLLFEVIEDDDNCSLSKSLEEFKLK